MEPFEDENPFSTADSSASSNTRVDVSAPPSPDNLTPTLPSSPHTPSMRSGFPSQGSGHASRPPTSKSDFCCVRDQWLHSGEDVEILVRIYISCPRVTDSTTRAHSDHRRPEDHREFNFALYHIYHPVGREFKGQRTLSKFDLKYRTWNPVIVTQNLSLCAQT
jgi:hypothetical protein